MAEDGAKSAEAVAGMPSEADSGLSMGRVLEAVAAEMVADFAGTLVAGALLSKAFGLARAVQCPTETTTAAVAVFEVVAIVAAAGTAAVGDGTVGAAWGDADGRTVHATGGTSPDREIPPVSPHFYLIR